MRKAACRLEQAFLPSQTDAEERSSSRDATRRRSLEIGSLAGNERELFARVRECVPELASRWLAEGKPTKIEASIVVHRDGDFFDLHVDNGLERVSTRALTFVYYFSKVPAMFSGGELQIFQTRYIDGQPTAVRESPVVVEPKSNSVVFFPAHMLHRVMPIRLDSAHFDNSRFAVNGWVHFDFPAVERLDKPPWLRCFI